MNTYIIFVLALAAGVATDRAVAGVPALACSGCSAAQEEQKALGAPNTAHGYSFVYNVADRRIRKFEAVVPGDGGGTAPLGGKAYGGTPIAASGAGARELWEYPVDPGVRKVFDAVVSLESAAPGFLAGKSAVTVPIRTLGPVSDELNAPPHDPNQIAWHWPPSGGSAYNIFTDRVGNVLENAQSANRFDPRVGKGLFEVQLASKTVGLSIGRAGLAIGLDLDGVAKLLKVKLCDDADTCVQMAATFNDSPAYENVIDRYGIVLPMMHTPKFRVEWPANGRDGAYAFAAWLRAERAAAAVDDKTGGKTTCGGYVLACERKPLAGQSTCRLECR